MQLLTASGEDDVLFVQLDLLHAIADAVGTGAAGACDGVIHALDLERCGKAGGDGARHGLRDPIRTDPAQAAFSHNIRGFHLVGGGGTAGPGDDSGTLVGYIGLAQTGIGDGLLH